MAMIGNDTIHARSHKGVGDGSVTAPQYMTRDMHNDRSAADTGTTHSHPLSYIFDMIRFRPDNIIANLSNKTHGYKFS